MQANLKRAFVALILLTSLAADAGGNIRLRAHMNRTPWTPEGTLGATVVKAVWDAQDYALMTDDGSGAISSWRDRMSALAVTATTTARPTWSATSFVSDSGNKPGVTCDGTTDAPATTTLTALPTGATAGEIWVVGTFGSTGAQQNAVTYGNNTASTGRAVRLNASALPQVSDNTVVTAHNVAASGNHIMMGDWSGTTQTGYIDGVAFSGNPGTIASLNTGTVRLRLCSGNGTSASSFANLVIAAVYIVSGQLSTADRQRMEGYIAWRENITSVLAASHPYKLTPP